MNSPTPTATDQPVAFRAISSRKQTLDAADFRGRVPVVLTFVGDGPDADRIIQALDAELHQFGSRRIQLIVVVPGEPTHLAERLQVAVALLADEGLGERLQAQPDGQGRIASVILATDGCILETVRQLPAADQALAILVAVDRLIEQQPDRLAVLGGADLPESTNTR